MPLRGKILAQERDRMLAQGQAGMAAVLDDVVRICHLPKFDVGFLLLSDRLHLALSRINKEWQSLIAQSFDCPQRMPSLKFERWQLGRSFPGRLT
jgi:hypothetical protein